MFTWYLGFIPAASIALSLPFVNLIVDRREKMSISFLTAIVTIVGGTVLNFILINTLQLTLHNWDVQLGLLLVPTLVTVVLRVFLNRLKV